MKTEFPLRGEQLCFGFAYDHIEDEAGTHLNSYLAEAQSCARRSNWQIAPAVLGGGRRILGSGRLLQTAVLLAAIERVVVVQARANAPSPIMLSALARLVSRIARRKLPFRAEQSETLIALLCKYAPLLTYAIPVLGILYVLKRDIAARGPSRGMVAGFRELEQVWQDDWYFNPLRIIRRRIVSMLKAAECGTLS